MLQRAHPSAWGNLDAVMKAVFGGEPWMRGDFLGAVGIGVSLLGFMVAIWQLRKTRKAAVAAEDAFRESGRSHFLFLLPQLRQYETEFDLGVQADDRQVVARALSSYAYLSNEIAAFVDDLDLSGPDSVTVLRRAAGTAADTKHEIIRNRSKKLVNATAEMQTCMRDVATHVATLGAAQRSGTPKSTHRRLKWRQGG